jgi:hypothetical protein
LTAKAFAFVIFVQITMLTVHSVLQGVAGEMTDISMVLSMRVFLFKHVMGIPLTWPNMQWVESAWNLMTWNYVMFSSTWGIWLRLFLASIFQGAMIWGFMTHILPNLIAGVSALVNFLVNVASVLNPFRYLSGTS